MRRTRTVVLAACAAALAVVPTAAASQGRIDSPRDPRAQRFVKAVSLSEITEHQRALQEIASANGDNRAVLGSGYAESLQYVKRTLERSGYRVTIDQFNHPVWKESQPAVLKQLTPTAKTYRPGSHADDGSPNVDFITLGYAPTKSVAGARVVPTSDIVDPLPAPGASTSGCEAADFPAETRGNIALVQRGTCAFVDKAVNAQAAGAAGVIIFNDGAGPDRQNPVAVLNQVDLSIPAVISSHAVGKELYDARAQSPTADLSTFGFLEDRFLPQVLAETRWGDPNHVVVVGAHLDSVAAGPGINDDGSGIATILTQAQELARHPTRRKIRFAWWGAEEDGLVGSTYYAHNLSQAEVDKIDVMLDYDMLASSNYIRFVYDGDGSTPGNPAGPPGSGVVERVHNDWFASKGLRTDPTPFDGRSDYVGFTDRGIPAGGVFSGAEGVKTAEQEQIYGGAAGSWYDPCYHQLCDNLLTVFTGIPPLAAEGLNSEDETPTDAEKQAAALKMRGGALKSLDQMSDAASYAVWFFSSARRPFGTADRPQAQARALSAPASGQDDPAR